MNTIDKLKQSEKLEFHTKIIFNLKDGIMDKQQAESYLYNIIGDLYKMNLQYIEEIDMEIL